ncbi:MAG: SusC/RagA family TonB-linked outer membrane protein [Mediterranea sp.]|jgi:iron complex outermembrane receptor protein|nr:SusC/RagA family TonB-linked outer membrane protein [Mediterranea sp.]
MRKKIKLIGAFVFAIGLCLSGNTWAKNNEKTENASVTQQGATLKGTVKDELGPVIGASVAIKGTAIGTVTNSNGNFELQKVTKGAVIRISCVGYAPQDITYTGQATLSVTLVEDATLLTDVVVTALGVKRSQKALGYSMTEVKGEDLMTNNINPIASLQGKVAGLEIAGSDGGMFGSVKIQVRGASTLKNNNQPIYVVDGVVLDNSVSDTRVNSEYQADPNDWGNELRNLNPNDFETVSVLKGAAATALYGSRGLNGAVVITTKSGRKSQGLGINFSQTFGIDHYYKEPDLQYVYGDGAFSGAVSWGEKDADGNVYKFDNQHQFYLGGDGVPELLIYYGFGPRYDGRPIRGYDGEMTTYDPYYNSIRDTYNLGFNSTTNVSVNGGNEKTTFYNSISYRNQSGTLPSNTFERLTLLSKVSHQLTSKVSLGASLTFANAKPANPQPNVAERYVQRDVSNNYDPNYYRHKYKGEHGGMATGDDKYSEAPSKDFWWNLYENERFQKETNVRPALELSIDLLSWLKLRLEGNYNYFYRRYEQKEMGSGYAREGGSYRLENYSKEQTNFYTTFQANKTLGDWSFGGFLRGEYFNNFEESTAVWTEGGLIVPGQFFINNSKNQIKSSGNINNTRRIMSTAFSANASWKEQLFVDITGRNDWSSALIYSTGTGNYSYFYPSISTSWLLNETFALPDWISLAKLRASWAQVGNDTDPYSINSAYSVNSHQQNGYMLYTLSIPESSKSLSLKPERKNSLELGLDWRFFQSRLNLDVALYKDNTIDQIMSIPVPYASGISSQLVNAGNIQGKGIEVALGIVPIKTKDWRWDVNFTYTRHEGKVISLHENVANYISLEGQTGGDFMVMSVAQENGAYGTLMTNVKPRIDEKTGLELYTWNNTYRSPYSLRSGKTEEIGKITPDFLGSILTDLKWKNIGLRIALDTDIGRYVASYPSRYGKAYGATESSLKYSAPEYGGVTWTSKYDGKTYSDGYIPPGVIQAGSRITQPDGSVYVVADGGEKFQTLYEKGIVEPTHASTWHRLRGDWGLGVLEDDWFCKADFVALREVTFSYRLPVSIATKIKAKNLTLSLSGRNLAYLYNTAPSHENPESVRGTHSGEFRLRSFQGFTANYFFTINADF